MDGREQNESSEIVLIDQNNNFVYSGDLRNGKFKIQNDGDRAFLIVSKELMIQIGGREVLTRDLFPKVFNGSWPFWGTFNSDGSYSLELVIGNTTNKQLYALLDLIEATNAKPTISPSVPPKEVEGSKNSFLERFFRLFRSK